MTEKVYLIGGSRDGECWIMDHNTIYQQGYINIMKERPLVDPIFCCTGKSANYAIEHETYYVKEIYICHRFLFFIAVINNKDFNEYVHQLSVKLNRYYTILISNPLRIKNAK